MHCTRCRNNTDLVYQHLCLIEEGGPSASYIYMHCARSIKKTNVVYWYARHLGLIDGGGCASYIYIYTGGSRLNQIFWEHENQSGLLVIWLIVH